MMAPVLCFTSNRITQFCMSCSWVVRLGRSVFPCNQNKPIAQNASHFLTPRQTFPSDALLRSAFHSKTSECMVAFAPPIRASYAIGDLIEHSFIYVTLYFRSEVLWQVSISYYIAYPILQLGKGLSPLLPHLKENITLTLNTPGLCKLNPEQCSSVQMTFNLKHSHIYVLPPISVIVPST